MVQSNEQRENEEIMDAKITIKRLKDWLTYDWLKVVGVAIAGILVWTLVFNFAATRIRPSQSFTVFNYTGNYSLSDTDYNRVRASLLGEDVFSYEVIETGEMDLTTMADLVETQLQNQIAINHVNVMFIANDKDTKYEYKDEQGNGYYKTYLERFAEGQFGTYMYELGEKTENNYFKQVESFLNRFYGDWKDKSSLNEEKVKAEFLARAKKNKDKRFKTEEEKQQGAKDDIKRIEKYRDALENIYGYLEKGYISITEVPVQIQVDNQGTTETFYRSAINLCPNEETMGGLKDIVKYDLEYEENGEKKTRMTAKDMHLVLFNLVDKKDQTRKKEKDRMEDGFQYENLLFTDNLVRYVLENSK